MNIEIRTEGKRAVVTVSGSLTRIGRIEGLDEKIDELLQRGFDEFVLTLDEASHIDSRLLGQFVRNHVTITRRGGSLQVIGLTRHDDELLSVFKPGSERMGRMPDLERWRATWKGLGVSRADDRLYSELTARYAEPHRHYHTPQHLDECFARLDEARSLADRVYEVELSLWFHDAVYEVRNHDNEEQSASWARATALEAGLSSDVADRVSALIMATKHDAAPATPDAALLVDVDLSILGAPVERFDEYERQVRQEYAWVPGFLFRRKRREILEAFLARPHIYSTGHFRMACEAQARTNLERSIKHLGG